MNNQSLKKAISFIRQEMSEKSAYLIELDQQNGDGDLGISMKEGFRAADEYLAASDETDLGRLIMGMAGALNESAPSSLGTILFIGFMGMAKALKGKCEAGTLEAAEALAAGIDKIMEKAHSKPGEKTILDSLCPGIQALKEHADKTTGEAYHQAALAAGAGAEATRGMLSKHGRAAYYGEKSLGILDGGAVVGQLIFEAVYRSIVE